MTELTIRGLDDDMLIEVSRALLEKEERLSKRYCELVLKAKNAMVNGDVNSFRVCDKESEEVYDKITKIARFNDALLRSLQNEEES